MADLVKPLDTQGQAPAGIAPPGSRVARVAKRALDLAGAAGLLVALSPLLLLCAVALRLESPGPVLFRQPRHGLHGRLIPVHKFRTMRHEAADLPAARPTRRDDPRVTRVGAVLRRTSLDELPQLVDVLRGDMSLVGPRPHAPGSKAGRRRFAEAVPGYARRHRVKPGMTGWAQVNGWRGPTETAEALAQRLAHDLWYIDNWSLWLDLKILARTPFALVGRNVF